MKKIFTFIFAVALSLNMLGQSSLTQAVDFTVTDCHGTEINLFNLLDNGQYVLIDFFYVNCVYCQQSTPKIVESYYSFGCNQHDVYYMEVSYVDHDAACQSWANNYGAEYPTVGVDGGGNSVTNAYGISYFPTVILIAPDHSVVIQDLYPIPSAQAVITALENHGVQQHECGPASSDPEVTISVDQVGTTEVTATFTPNEECFEYFYMMATEEEFSTWMAAAGLYLPEYLRQYGFPGTDAISHTFTDLEIDTEYLICAVPADDQGNLYDVAQETVVTTPGGGGEVIEDFTGIDTDGNEIHLYDILNNGQSVLINFFLTGDPFSEDIMGDMVEAYRLYGCNQHDVFFMEISGNGSNSDCQTWIETYGVQYPTISKENGGQAIVQAIPVALYPTIMLIRPDHTIAQRDIYPPTLEFIVMYMEEEGIQQYECEEGIDEIEKDIYTLYPNPANEFLSIKGENIGNVMIFNAIGQKVAEYFANDELNIKTSDFNDGVYFVKIGDVIERFVVTH